LSNIWLIFLIRPVCDQSIPCLVGCQGCVMPIVQD
jgi:hypothetical protein